MFRRGGSSAAFFIDRTRKIHTTFPDGSELVEEYDEDTRRVTARRRRRPAATGAAGAWEVLLGPPQPERAGPAAAAGASNSTGLLLQESITTPRCVRQDTPGCFTWTIRNLHYPPDTYSVTLDPLTHAIIVSTSNKKYYKRLDMPEMQLLQLVCEVSRLSWCHEGDTLTVHYTKPPALLAEELADSKAAAAMRVQEDPANCRQQ